jgi:hypothetical protein
MLNTIKNDFSAIADDVATVVDDTAHLVRDGAEILFDDLVMPAERDLTSLFHKSSDIGRGAAKRARTRSPYVDGLVGVEPNPGPKSNRKPPPKLPRKKDRASNGNGGRNYSKYVEPVNKNRGLKMNFGGAVSVPAAVGYTSTKRDHTFVGLGTRMVLGSPAHIFSGRCAVQNLYSTAGSTFSFADAGGNVSSFMYLNPRICCQNTTYQSPQGNCPIGVIAQAFRKFSFRKLVLCYQPTAAATTMSATVAYCFDPEVLATTSLGANVMNYANFEASSYGPVWKASKLDMTPWLDRSKWYYGETGGAMATSIINANAVQGTVTLCSNAATAASTTYGMFFLEFELALSELGPTEVYTAPTLKQPDSDEKKEVETWIKIVEPGAASSASAKPSK